jgi:hypothetical protein
MENQPFMIFIAGVPSESTKSELIEYFQKLGKIKSIQPKLCQTKPSRINSAPGQAKLYWLLEAADYISYVMILDYEDCYLKGRKLHLAPFKSGTSLIMYNNIIARRRALIKKVPSWFPEQKLINLIERGFGPLASYFRYKPDKDDSPVLDAPSRIRKFLTYSVTFQIKSDRDDIVRVRCIHIAHDIKATVEKYVRRNARKHKILSAQQKSGEDSTEANTGSPNPNKPELRQVTEKASLIKPKQSTSLPLEKLMGYGDSLPEDSSNSAESIDRECSRQSAVLKPSRAKYHMLKRQKAMGMCKTLADTRQEEVENLRFNLPIRSARHVSSHAGRHQTRH